MNFKPPAIKKHNFGTCVCVCDCRHCHKCYTARGRALCDATCNRNVSVREQLGKSAKQSRTVYVGGANNPTSVGSYSNQPSQTT